MSTSPKGRTNFASTGPRYYDDVVADAIMAQPLWSCVCAGYITQGFWLTSNPGLCDGIPLGFFFQSLGAATKSGWEYFPVMVMPISLNNLLAD
ncbi:MAG: hypothetical protein SGI71_05640 [Verrucomicrobiota bacterium]|nr:hypothetical protein [Verrucomicrobiota bacterium]